MLQAYVDGSGTGDRRFLVLAGYVAASEVWAAFSEAWQARLTDAGMPFFKMNRMASRPEIAGWFYRTLEEFDIRASIACVINTAELVEVEKSVVYPAYITNPNSATNPYYLGFKYITGILAQR
jgi:spore cortex formation protein SpoVR/YcgB (stage V sporulation)